MFTGLIQAVSTLVSIEPMDAGLKLIISRPVVFGNLTLGESIAMSGVCMTVTTFDESVFAVEASHETLIKSSLGKLSVGAKLNLERALLPTERLGGHFVTGHVDGLARIVSIQSNGIARDLIVELLDAELQPYFIPKGSVALNGISLTVNWINGLQFGVTIIPHTWSNTALATVKQGDIANIETDMLGKYIVQNMKLLLPAAS